MQTKAEREAIAFRMKIEEWYELQSKLKELVAVEHGMRKEIFGEAFPTPKEGQKENKFSLGDGYILQGNHKINRSVDNAVYDALHKQLATGATDDDAELLKKLEAIIRWKPEVVNKEWKALDDDDALFFADLVTEKVGTPSLEIKKPARS